MTILKLTDIETEKAVYINADNIMAFHEDYEAGTKVICGVNGGHVFFVKEDPGTILKLMNLREEFA